MADNHTKIKFDWLDQVARDAKVSAEAFKLAYILASEYLNRGTGDAWPSQAVLAQKLCRSVRWIHLLIAQLADGGHLTVTVGGGRGHSNRYKPLLKPAATAGGRDDDATLFPEDHDVAPAAAGVDRGGSFEEFWQHYPRRVAKAYARRKYEQIISRGTATAADLIAGAMRYAAERDGQDATYTKHPGTWLNGECWRDETAAPRGPHPTPPGHHPQHPSGAMSAIAGVADWLDNGAIDGDIA